MKPFITLLGLLLNLAYKGNHLRATGFGETFGDVLPVNDIENRLHIVGLNVLVLQIVGVFPNVDAQQWFHTLGRL